MANPQGNPEQARIRLFVLMEEVASANTAIPDEELERIIDEEVAAVRAERNGNRTNNST